MEAAPQLLHYGAAHLLDDSFFNKLKALHDSLYYPGNRAWPRHYSLGAAMHHIAMAIEAITRRVRSCTLKGSNPGAMGHPPSMHDMRPHDSVSCLPGLCSEFSGSIIRPGRHSAPASPTSAPTPAPPSTLKALPPSKKPPSPQPLPPSVPTVPETPSPSPTPGSLPPASPSASGARRPLIFVMTTMFALVVAACSYLEL